MKIRLCIRTLHQLEGRVSATLIIGGGFTYDLQELFREVLE